MTNGIRKIIEINEVHQCVVVETPSPASDGYTPFVFIAANGQPTLIKEWEGEIWSFWWHPDKHWVSGQKLGDYSYQRLKQFAISPEAAALYGV